MVGVVNARRVGRFGGILWEPAGEIDRSISFVHNYDNPNEAIRQLSERCGRAERWAVVDLETLGVVASGPGVLEPQGLSIR
jgi:hypothetical protein